MNKLDKAEYRIKLDQINKLADAGDYEGAAGIVDTIDWRRVKSVRTLCMVGEIYEVNNRLEDSSRILKIAYKRSAISKTVLYRLAELAIKLGELDEAVDYYSEFAELAPNDNSQYILKYQLYKARKSPIEDQIEILEEYKSREYTEEWAFELAKLYQKAGMKDKCVEECDDIILWFSEGTYVNRAMELKMKFGTLSPSQQIKYDNRFVEETKARAKTVAAVAAPAPIEEEEESPDDTSTQASVTETIGKMDAAAESAIQESSAQEVTQAMPTKVNANALNLQSQLADSIRAVFAGINNKGVSVSDIEQPSDEEDDVKEYIPAKEENIAEYKVKDLEPENIGHPAEKLAAEPALQEEKKADGEQIAGQMSLADYAKPKDPEDVDLEALFAETTSSLAQQVSTGEFAKVDELEKAEEEKRAKAEEEARIKAEEEAKAKAEEEARIKAEEEARAKAEEEAKAKAAAEETISLEKETDETLGLTREFNFHQELQKAIVSGNASGAAADILKKAYDDIETIPDSAVEDTREAELGDETADEKAVEEEIRLAKEMETQDVPDLEDESKIDAVSGVAAGIFAAGMAAVAGAHVPASVEMPEIEEPILEEQTWEELILEESDAEENLLEEPVVEEVEEEPVVEEIEEEPVIEETDEEQVVEEPLDEEPAVEENLEEELIAEDGLQKEAVTEKIDLGEVFTARNAQEEPEPEPSIEDIVAQEPDRMRKVPIEPRKLDEVEKKLFSYFAPIPGMGEQITEALCDVHNNAGDKTSRSGNILLAGRQGSGKTRLADGMIQAICRDLDIKAAKTAKVVADDFNKKDAVAVVAKLAGGFLVIEGAGGLSDASVASLIQAMEFRTDGLIVMLEDEKPDLRDLLNRHPQLSDFFTSSISVPVFTNDELVSFAKTYAKEQGYKMDEVAVLALYTMIGDNQKDSEPITVGRVKDMMDAAIHRANRGTRKLGRKFSKKSVDEENRVFLYEKDFDFD
ncbi:MAG: hypothetical protein PHS82_05415 [Lachnospiraceae bacterium]|nr:hypothetical protein [Lachnospiraceae bacterium]